MDTIPGDNLPYPRVVRLYHGKKFKVGIDFVEIHGKVLVAKVHEGYPALQSKAIHVGDVIAKINGEEVTTVRHAINLCECKGGRGTDETVEIHTTHNLAIELQMHLQDRMGYNGASPSGSRQSSPGMLIRSLSWSKRRNSSGKDIGNNGQQKQRSKRNVWDD